MISTLVNISVFSLATASMVSLGVLQGSSQTPSAQALQPLNRQVAQTTQSAQTLEQAVNAQVNQYRLSRGLRPLTLDPRISKQALAHSQGMANGRVPFSHNGFQQRVKEISRSINYRGAAENVAYNSGYRDPVQQAVQGWLKSPGHRKNIEGQFDLTGIGVTQNAKGEYYFTQIFIRRR